ncbi:LuxR C-terminal-related transcriptional regulator [Pseudomonas sp. KNUC1026]|uniref:LuxR C-terminal-related transcriptional regulator n=1 Tax=Pseudomonas sp. KNUC1026 TaxID=2893890 RepID=UPI001F478FC3|nr:LuxR C-terminal-related transcriptional regulator [Pseudomonas sp. KNUC1026]UFH51664.1 LuxR C-terminal-related transcriptional regulator [Pseudomonas sp. KNUC1026]
MVLTALREPCALGSILGLGVRGVVSKRAEAIELARAASQVAAGRSYLCSDVQHIMGKRYTHRSAWACEATTALTEREQQVLDASRTGLSARKIAEQMQRSERSVQRQRRRAMEKLGLQADAELCHRP